MPKPKTGKVIRVSKEIEQLLEKERRPGEPYSRLVERIIKGDAKTIRWVLPSHIFDSVETARFHALSEAVQANKEFDQAELPTKVLKR